MARVLDECPARATRKDDSNDPRSLHVQQTYGEKTKTPAFSIAITKFT